MVWSSSLASSMTSFSSRLSWELDVRSGEEGPWDYLNLPNSLPYLTTFTKKVFWSAFRFLFWVTPVPYTLNIRLPVETKGVVVKRYDRDIRLRKKERKNSNNNFPIKTKDDIHRYKEAILLFLPSFRKYGFPRISHWSTRNKSLTSLISKAKIKTIRQSRYDESSWESLRTSICIKYSLYYIVKNQPKTI